MTVYYYLDFQKAFDSLSHESMNDNLVKVANVIEEVLGWINAYVQGKIHSVTVSGAVSRMDKVTSVLTQGSI